MTASESAPQVWQGLDQATLDKAYDQAQWAPNMVQVMQRCAQRSERTRAAIGAPRRMAYGPTDIEALDFFDCGRAGAPVQVFFHGGAWRSGKAEEYAFLAELFLPAGVHLVVPDFAWVQQCGGDLRTLAEQTRRALAWTHANAARLGADPDRLFLSGHSSGAHLGAVLATTDWTEHGLPPDTVKGALLCSGMYELEPVRRSSRSRYVSIDDAAAAALSPIRHLGRARPPLVVAWGTLESPEFQRQGREFAGTARDFGASVATLQVAQRNHFEMLETLADPGSDLARAALTLTLSG